MAQMSEPTDVGGRRTTSATSHEPEGRLDQPTHARGAVPAGLRSVLSAIAPDFAVTHLSLSITRIAFYTAVFGDLVDIYSSRSSIYLPQHSWVGDAAVPLCLLTTALVVVGYRTRLFLVANYFLVFLVLYAARAQYHFDFIVRCASFVFLFSPAPRRLSVDSFLRRADSGPEPLVPRRFVVLMFASLALMYLDSIFWKYASTSWRTGSTFWLAAGLPIFSAHRLPEWMEIDWLMRVATYVALLYETLFPLVLIRRLRTSVAVTGILLHLGIAVFFPLPWFGLGVAALVAMFVRWEALLGHIVRRGTPAPDGGRPVPVDRQPAHEQNGRVATPVTYAVVAAMALCQATVINDRRDRWIVHDVMGIYPHPIFIDLQFNLRRPVLRYEVEKDGRTIPIPSFDEQGYPTVDGRLWTELVAYLRFDPAWEARLYRYLDGWLEENSVEESPVKVYYKDVVLAAPVLDFPERERMERRQWALAGTIAITARGQMLTRWEPAFLARYDQRKLNPKNPESTWTRIIDYGEYERAQPLFKTTF